jgi:PAS domain S-box-containing protein
MVTEAPRTAEERFRMLVEGVVDYAIFMLDPEGRVTTWNAGAQRIKGYAAEEILGHHFSRFYPPEVAASGWPEHELEVARTVGRFEDEGWRLRKDGTRFWANVVITAVRDETGTLHGFSKITRDLTERRMQEEILSQSEERFRLLVEGVRDYAIFMLDPEGRVASWNAGAERIKGYAAEEIMGRHFSQFYPPEKIASGWPEHELEVASAEGRFEDEGWRLRKDGTRFWANVVITALHDREGRLRGFAKLTRDLSERKRVEELEHGERQTTEFLAMLAHELRNPLAPIRNAVLALQAGPEAGPGPEWATEVIDRQVTHLARLVDDLLDVSRITSGKIELRLEPIEVADLVARAIESSRQLIEDRGHSLEVALPEEPLWVQGDAVRLSQVFLNLLNNAAKYTPEGGRIEIAAERDRGQAAIRVRDSGVGIASELLPRVFDLFTQGERALDRAEAGLGVGLTLVERLVRRHGGSVAAASEGPGRGSEFVVRLPLLERAPARPARPAPEAEAPLTGRRRVLVVDDNADSAGTMAVLLRLWGHEARSAEDGEAALAIAKEFRPEAVLLDIGLPQIDGYEVARRLRALPELEGVLLIAMTGYGQEQDRRRARRAGFDHHLVKPADPEELRRLLALAPTLSS